MSTRTVKDPSASDGLLPAVLIAGLVAVVGGSVWAGIHLGTDQAAPGNPIAIVKGLIRGELVWETGSTLVVALVLAAVIALVVATAVLVRRVQGRRPASTRKRRSWAPDATSRASPKGMPLGRVQELGHERRAQGPNESGRGADREAPAHRADAARQLPGSSLRHLGTAYR